MTHDSKALFAVLLLALAVATAFQGSRGLYETSEGRYAETAREMLTTGSYLEPTLEYRHHWSKPPLTYWCIAAGMRLFGQNEWGVRFYNLVAFPITALSVAIIGTALFGAATGFTAGCVYATSIFPALSNHAVTTDTLLTLWETLAMLCFVVGWRGGSTGNRARAWNCAMWAFFGLGFATKGPPALLPLTALLVWKHHEREKTRIVTPCGLLAFAGLGLSWYVAVGLMNEGLFAYFLGEEIIGRVASSRVHNHAWYKAFTIYIPVLVLGAGWWLYPAVKTIRKLGLWRPSRILGYARKDFRYSFLLMWIALPLCVFMLSRSKLHLYVLPLFVPLAILLGRAISAVPAWRDGRLTRRMACAGCAVLIGIKGAMAVVDTHSNIRPLARECLRYDTPDTEYIAFMNSRLHGLQFYLQGRLARVSISGSEPWADLRMRDLLSQMASSPPERTYVLFVRNSSSQDLADILDARSLGYDREQRRQGSLFVLHGAGEAPSEVPE